MRALLAIEEFRSDGPIPVRQIAQQSIQLRAALVFIVHFVPGFKGRITCISEEEALVQLNLLVAYSWYSKGCSASTFGRFFKLQMVRLVQFGNEAVPRLEPYALLFPVTQAPPAGAGRWILRRQAVPACSGFQHPQNPFDHSAIVGR
jgi:hypothetical protein